MDVYELDYWTANLTFVGRIREFPSVVCQGRTFEELVEGLLRELPQLRRPSVHLIHNRLSRSADIDAAAKPAGPWL